MLMPAESSRRRSEVWFFVGSSLVIAVQCASLAECQWDATAFLHVGETSPARRQIERELGLISVVPGLGHDGKYFYLLARHPWFWQADAELLDGVQDPGYRFGRPLYPLIAGLGGMLSPRGTLAGLLVVQVIAGGLLVFAFASLARQNGLPIFAILLGLGTPGIYSSSILLTSDLLALALTMLGVLNWQRERSRRSVAWFAAAILAKEYYALTPLVLAASSIRSRPLAALAVGVLPIIPLLAWRVAVASAFGLGQGAENFTWPGGGILATAGEWERWTLGALAMLLVVISLAGIVRTSRPLPRWQCVAWGSLGLCASRLVWTDPADLLRVISPAWWFAIWCWCPRVSTRTGDPTQNPATNPYNHPRRS
jgi:hypothetical protein